MLKESAMKKWFKFEIARINSGIVTKKKTLSELLTEKTPSCEAKDGSIYYFNKDTLLRLKDELPDAMHSIMLPLTFYTDLEVRRNVYIAEKSSLSLLKHLGEIPEDAELSDGKYWMSKALVLDVMKRWPTMIQFVRY